MMTKSSKKQKPLKSPLRFPGGKSRLVKQIALEMPSGVFKGHSNNIPWEYREPFFGGGSMLFYLKNNQDNYSFQNYCISDKFEPLYNFWTNCKNNIDPLYKEVLFTKDFDVFIGKLLYEVCHKRLKNEEFNRLDKAAAFFVLNRITFSGLTMSGGYSQSARDTRFSYKHINRLKDANLALKDVEVLNADYTVLLFRPGENVWLFLDPPYDIKSDNLYGKSGSTHKGFDHVKFADDCKACKHKWLITYNDNENIRKLFSWANIKEQKVKYSLNSKAKERLELFITNY